MKKIIINLAIVAMTIGSATARPVDAGTARRVADTYMSAMGMKNVTSLNDITAETPFSEFYVFASDEGGFILVSADDRVMPVLGYSVDRPFITGDIPENVRGVLDGYEDEIRHAKKTQATATEPVARQWELLTSGQMTPAPLTSAVAPLLSTTWSQRPYYNALCPVDENESGDHHIVSGCVATATAQIMKYHNFPTTGYGSHSYDHSTYGTLSANFGNTTYQWANMPNALTSSSSSAEVDAVATLIYHVGVADEMEYNLSALGGSGAINYNYSSSTLKASSQTSLMKYFKYCPDMAAIHRADYNDAEYCSILRDELDQSRPILYSGSGGGGGHSFVCDGYNNGGKFHINWGWGGSYDGYFTMGRLTPGGGGPGSNSSNNYSNDNVALIGIRPNTNWSSTGSTSFSATCNFTGATISGTGSHPFGETVFISVTGLPEGYRFERWNDGDRNNPRLFYANGGTYNLTAQVGRLSGDTLSYCGNYCDPLSYHSITDNRWGIRLPASVLTTGDSLMAVQNYIYFAGTYTLTVYTGTTTPATAVYTTTRTFTSDDEKQWKTFILDSPLIVDGSQNLWLTFSSTDVENPAISTYSCGNPDGFLTGNNMVNTSSTRTFMIRGLFGQSSITPPETVDICEGVTAPYSLDYESSNYDDMLDCWTNLDADGDGHYWEFSDSIIISRSWWGEVLTPNNWFISPDISLPAGGTYALTWKDRPYSTSYYQENYGIFINTTGSTAPADFTLLQNFTPNPSATWTPRSLDLSAYAGQTVRLAFRHYNVSDQEALYLTAIAVTADNVPVPPEPIESTHTVTATANNATMGTVTGGGTYDHNATATLTAIPLKGFAFQGWSNGAEDNPYSFAVTIDTNLVAQFSLSGSGDTATVYDTVTITNYDTVTVTAYDTVTFFDTTSVTSYDTVTVIDTVTLTNYDTVTVTAYDTVTFFDTTAVTISDTVTILDTLVTLDTVTITNYDTITVTAFDTVTITNYDTVTSYDTVTITNYDTITSYDTVTVTNYETVTTYDTITVFDTVDIVPIPDDPCVIYTFPYVMNFSSGTPCWTTLDLNGDNQTWGIVTDYGVDSSRCAYVSYAPNADDWLVSPPIVSGGYTVTWKAAIISPAYPETYQVLVLHDDGATDTLFSETLRSGTFVDRLATFTIPEGETQRLAFRYISDDQYVLLIDDIVIMQGLTEFVHDTTYVDVPYPVHDTTYVDVPYPVHDTTYVNVPYPVHDTTYINVPYTVYDTAYIDVPYPVHDTTYVNVPYPVHDTTFVDVPYPVHDTTFVDVFYPVHDTTVVTLTDTVTFTVHDTVNNIIYDTTLVTDTLWLTHYDTIIVHDTVYIHDTIYVGVDDVEVSTVKLYQQNGQIVVEGAEGQRVAVYDAVGRMLAVKHDEYGQLRFDPPVSGVYLIKIGDAPARRIVVVR